MGFWISAIALLVVPIITAPRIFPGQTFFAGQATRLISVLFLRGIELIFLGIISEYSGRIHDEVKGSPS